MAPPLEDPVRERIDELGIDAPAKIGHLVNSKHKMVFRSEQGIDKPLGDGGRIFETHRTVTAALVQRIFFCMRID